jgi:hypothetical protein
MSVGSEQPLTDSDALAIVNRYVENRDAAAEAAKPTTPPNTSGVSDSADVSAGAPGRAPDSQPPTPPPGPDWLDDDVRGLAQTLGLNDQQLAKFGSKDAFDSAISLLDMRAANLGRQMFQPPAQPVQPQPPFIQHPNYPDRRTDGTFLPHQEFQSPPSQVPQQVMPPPGQQSGQRQPSAYKPSLDPNSFDEEVIKEFGSLHASLDQRISNLESLERRLAAFEQSEQAKGHRVMEERFDAVVESLGEPALFGETGKETMAQMENRRKLFAAHMVHLAGLRQLGWQGHTDKAFVGRAARMEFADHFNQKQRNELTQKVRQQSGKRLGSSQQRSELTEWQGPPEKNPKLIAAYRKMEAESGG